MNTRQNKSKEARRVQQMVFVVFGVGVVGFLLPFSHPYFVKLTPFILLLTLLLLAIYHEKYKKRELIAFAAIYILGYLIEVLGVNTGLIFGSYQYGDGLGIKCLGTPLLIGCNWLFLSYCAVSIASKISKNKLVTCFLAPFFLLIYDLLLEQMAPKMNMWSWQNNTIPLQNYVAWWVIGSVCVAILLALQVNTKNRMALPLYVAHILFLLLLFLFA